MTNSHTNTHIYTQFNIFKIREGKDAGVRRCTPQRDVKPRTWPRVWEVNGEPVLRRPGQGGEHSHGDALSCKQNSHTESRVVRSSRQLAQILPLDLTPKQAHDHPDSKQQNEEWFIFWIKSPQKTSVICAAARGQADVPD